MPGAIWALGLGSLLMDTSSELIHSVLPVFLVSVLGASMSAVGVIEGVAEATASIAKVFSGAISDYVGKRKFLIVLGYGMAAVTKPIFPLATSYGSILAARFVDRIGKGIRGAPRDALIGDIVPPEIRGAAFGLRQSLDTVGAFLGPLLALALMLATANNFRLVFWVAVVPAALAVLVFAFGIKDRPRPGDRHVRSPIHAADLRTLGASYWWVMAVASAFAVARFSEAFLILRAREAGLAVGLVPLVLVVMNVVYTGAAYPAGYLSDRVSRWSLVGIGLVVLLAADLVLVLAPGIVGVMVGSALWGLHMGLTQGVFAALVADVTPAPIRGTGFGLFNLASGIESLVASVVAGVLWQQVGSHATFLAGAGLTVCAGVGAVVAKRRDAVGRSRPQV